MEEEVRRADFTFVHGEFEILAKDRPGLRASEG